MKGPAPNVHAVLAAAGFKNFRRRRADCPFCSGSSRLTVAITDRGLFYCHRCHRGGSIRGLAQRQGVSLPPPRIRLADNPKQQFRDWLSAKMNEMSKQEWLLYRRVPWARVCLRHFPEHDGAWGALATWYDAEHQFQIFWESASDRLGRFWMYRAWRRRHAH
jgi:hypothetical protein